jgi:GT2 family glycosyltransferase
MRASYFQEMSKKAVYLYKREGILIFLKAVVMYALYGRQYFQQRNRSSQEQYRLWRRNHERLDIASMQEAINGFVRKPKISVIVPVYNVDPKWLNKCIESVISQVYETWELCLHDDASTDVRTVECLRGWSVRDDRIRVSFGEKNLHISGASNEALKLATGEFVALLDNDDELSSDALFEVVKCVNEHPEADVIYSDEDMLDEKGRRFNPFFKPGWTPDLLLSMNYITHLCVYRKSLIDTVGGFRVGFEGSQDYDLVLRMTEQTKYIYRIPKILYHWRQLPTSTASGSGSKNYAYEAARRALEDSLERNGVAGEVIVESPGLYRVKRKIVNPKKVSIIIPFRDQADVLKRCVQSLRQKTDFSEYEIVLVNNQSSESRTIDYLKSLEREHDPKIRMVEYDKAFNFADMNNEAAKTCNGEYLLFLNNDTEVLYRGWLSSLVEQIQRDEVGAVGAKLFYPNNTVQHGGVILFGEGIATHAFKSFPRESSGYRNFLNVIRDYSAVTAACMITKRELFWKLGGFDAEHLPIAYNDVDYCLKVLEAGKLVVYTPYASLYHYESLSRGNDEDLKKSNPEKYQRVLSERKYMHQRWQHRLADDMYYNPNLTRSYEDFSLNF